MKKKIARRAEKTSFAEPRKLAATNKQLKETIQGLKDLNRKIEILSRRIDDLDSMSADIRTEFIEKIDLRHRSQENDLRLEQSVDIVSGNVARLREEFNHFQTIELNSGTRRSSMGVILDQGGTPIDGNASRDAAHSIKKK